MLMAKNIISIDPAGYAVLELKGGQLAYLDLEDLPVVAERTWQASPIRGRSTKAYVVSHREGRTVLLHRLLTNAGPGFEVDHDNGNGLDNRRHNLIVTTHSENLHNRKQANRQSKTGVRGVSLQQTKYGPRYVAAIQRSGKTKKRLFAATPEGLEAAAVYLAELQRRDAPSLDVTPQAKLSTSDRTEILTALNNGARAVALARQYGVREEAISLLRRGRTWRA